eukprot:CAMPEP_0181362770 /NCGR_PEP_ID=MMETSP1106-20121128/8254_1 /TAXON_ID=81844 /ORGANISM="Mantoniella antarctica, Strain SL-175" /LENGTH=206 /DNA_ID=CAMNT_0023476887 /DNA_START=75 /DNA_END=695 /DNA_ORIENTATION=+
MSLSASTAARPALRASRASAARASAAPKSGAARPTAASAGRRDAVMLGASALQLLVASKAWALIPGNDDEDDELLAKAKAGRVGRIQTERALEKTYVTKNELKSDVDTAKVQVAVFKLSKAGGLIESGDLPSAAEALGLGSWVTDLSDAGAKLGQSPKAFLEDVIELKKACVSSDAKVAKKAYVKAARSLETFAKDTKTAETLKLL